MMAVVTVKHSASDCVHSGMSEDVIVYPGRIVGFMNWMKEVTGFHCTECNELLKMRTRRD